MLTKFSLKAIPLAAAMTAALVFGAAAQAQSGAATESGDTKGQDAAAGKKAPKTAEERSAAKAAKADKKAARVAKRTERKGKVDLASPEYSKP
ncbi:MAG: hypothetical protein ACREXG_16105 [Polaromonas sp.]